MVFPDECPGPPTRPAHAAIAHATRPAYGSPN